MERMWVNQPSTLQDDHKLHGTNVLMDDSKDPVFPDIYFLGGPVVSQKISRLSLSKGWRRAVTTCFLCQERPDADPPGCYAVAVATFRTEDERQLANKQREEANEPGRWFTANSVRDEPLNITQFPAFLFR